MSLPVPQKSMWNTFPHIYPDIMKFFPLFQNQQNFENIHWNIFIWNYGSDITEPMSPHNHHKSSCRLNQFMGYFVDQKLSDCSRFLRKIKTYKIYQKNRTSIPVVYIYSYQNNSKQCCHCNFSNIKRFLLKKITTFASNIKILNRLVLTKSGLGMSISE